MHQCGGKSAHRIGDLEILLPSRMQDAPQAADLSRGERQFIAAILDDVCTMYCKVGSSAHESFVEDIERWVDSADRTAPLSFERICAALALDPDHVRRRLRSRKRLATATRRPRRRTPRQGIDGETALRRDRLRAALGSGGSGEGRGA